MGSCALPVALPVSTSAVVPMTGYIVVETSSDLPANAVYYNGEPVYYDGEVVTYEV